MAYKPTFYTMREEYVKEQRKEREMIRRIQESFQALLSRPMFPEREKGKKSVSVVA